MPREKLILPVFKESGNEFFNFLCGFKSYVLESIHSDGSLRCDVQGRLRILPSGMHVLFPLFCESAEQKYSPEMLDLVIHRHSDHVLIHGETGTGKEMFALCVRELTKEGKKSFVELNCAEFGDNLVESELFGHIKGSFTGATADKEGLVAEAEGGVLYLDEFGWLEKRVQAKLLRFMVTGKYRPVGSTTVREAKNVRIIAATNANVTEVVLPDLLHRFDHVIKLPALRDRGSDFLWFFCEFLSREGGFAAIDAASVVDLLCAPWNGNMRELKKYCHRVSLFNSLKNNQASGDHVFKESVRHGGDSFFSFVYLAGSLLYQLEHHAQAYFSRPACHVVTSSFIQEFDSTTGLPLSPIWRKSVQPIFCFLINAVGPYSFYFLNDSKHFYDSHPRLDISLSVLKELFLEDYDDQYQLNLLALFCAHSAWGADFLSPDFKIPHFCDCWDFCDIPSALTFIIRTFFNLSTNLSKKPSVWPSQGYVETLCKHFDYDGFCAKMLESGGSAELERLLLSYGLDERDRFICVQYSKGLSGGEVAASMGTSKSTVIARLAALRSQYPDLAKCLSPHNAGRKKKQDSRPSHGRRHRPPSSVMEHIIAIVEQSTLSIEQQKNNRTE